MKAVNELDKLAWLSPRALEGLSAKPSFRIMLPALPPRVPFAPTTELALDPASNLAAVTTAVHERPHTYIAKWTSMYLTLAERVILQTSACKMTVNTSGHEIAVLLDTKLPLLTTLTALSFMVSCGSKRKLCA